MIRKTVAITLRSSLNLPNLLLNILQKNGESTKFKHIQTENELLVEVSSSKGVTVQFSMNGIDTLYKNIGEVGIKISQGCRHKKGDSRVQISPGDHMNIGSLWNLIVNLRSKKMLITRFIISIRRKINSTTYLLRIVGVINR